MSYIDVTGKTEEEAIRKALEQLGWTATTSLLEILERAKSGFLGIGSSPARVRVTYGQRGARGPDAAGPAGKKRGKEAGTQAEAKKPAASPSPRRPRQPKAAHEAGREAPKAAGDPAAPAQEPCEDDNARRIPSS